MTNRALGVAVLHGYDPDTGKVTTDRFVEHDGDKTSPWHRAAAIRDSVADDFPGWIWSIGQDERSHYLMYARNMADLCLDAEPYDEWRRQRH